MLKALRNTKLLAQIVALALLAASTNICHHDHDETTAPHAVTIVHLPALECAPSKAELSARPLCGCGAEHDAGTATHHRCACVCHVPAAIPARQVLAFDSTAETPPVHVPGTRALGFTSRIERPPRLS